MAHNCQTCGRFHSVRDGCMNVGHRQNRLVTYPTAPAHGHSLHDAQPRVKHQVNRAIKELRSGRVGHISGMSVVKGR